MLRCKLCALVGLDKPATYIRRVTERDSLPLCGVHAIGTAFKYGRVRSITEQDQAALSNPPLANPGRWKEQSDRNRPYPTRKTTTRHTGEK